MTSHCCEINAIWRIISKQQLLLLWELTSFFKLLVNHLLTKLLRLGVLFGFQANVSINSKARNTAKACRRDALKSMTPRGLLVGSLDPDLVSNLLPCAVWVAIISYVWKLCLMKPLQRLQMCLDWVFFSVRNTQTDLTQMSINEMMILTELQMH